MLRATKALPINPLTQLPSCLEVWNELLRHWHLLAGLRIAAGARRAVVDLKRAKPADLDALALHQAQIMASSIALNATSASFATSCG